MNSLQLPTFLSKKLSIWFIQVESVFRVNGIESDKDMYDHIIGNIPSKYICLVEDVIKDPPSQDRYEYIKEELLIRMSKYNLKKADMGTHKPSEYLQILYILGNQGVSKDYIINKWLTDLPKAVREIVALESSGDINILGLMADKVMALLPNTNQISTQNNALLSYQQLLDSLQNRLEELAEEVRGLRFTYDKE